jgi:signal transduction histidine kinase
MVRELFKVSQDVILILGDRGERLVDANAQLANRLGYSKKELRSFGPSKIFADEIEIRKFFQAVWDSKRTSSAHAICAHKSGRLIPATIRARAVSLFGSPAALLAIGLHPANHPPQNGSTEPQTVEKLLRVVGRSSFSEPNIKREFDGWLRRLSRVAHLPVAHVHVLSTELAGLAGCTDVWHVDAHKEYDRFRTCPDPLSLPEEFFTRTAAARCPQVFDDLDSQPQFQRSGIRDLHLRSAFAVPIVIGNEVSAVSEFFSNRPAHQDTLLVEVVHILSRELGYAIHHRSLSLKLTKLQDEERRRLARELHDTVAQSLSVLLLDLESVQEESVALSDRARSALARTMSLARQSLQEIRTFSYLLHPPVLDALGLLPALRVFIEGFSRRSGIRIVSEMPNSLPRMPDDWEMAVFRVVQEGLTNVQRHSRSQSAEVRFSVASGMATLRVINEGASLPSFESGGLAPELAGVGVAGMRERLRAFGGDVMLYSHDSKTILEATVPVPRSSRSPQLPLKF